MQIFISGWCLKEYIENGDFNVLDLPEFAINHGFSGIELMDRQIKLDTEYLKELKRKCQKFGCSVIIDIDSDLTYEDDSDWSAQISHVQNMLDVSKQVGAAKVRICLGGQSLSFQKIFKYIGLRKDDKENKSNVRNPMTQLIKRLLVNQTTYQLAKTYRKRGNNKIKNEEEKIGRSIEALKRILPIAEHYQITMGIENHWGISSFPGNILRVVNELDSPYVGTCPDFDNFPKKVDRYDGIGMLSSRAIHVHAKSQTFNVEGEESYIDYNPCLQILKDKGYNDTVTVEYEGRGDAIQGCLLTKELILKYW